MALQSNTKDRILDIAEKLLLEGGFDGFSYAHISSALGIRNAAIHYHYPTKADLGAAIIQRARRRFKKWREDIERRNVDLPKKLDEFFELFRHFLNSGKICFGGAVGINFTTLPIEMQTEAQGLGSDFLTWTENLLREGRQRGIFSFPGTPKDEAILVLACMQGILQIARHSGPSCFDAAVRQIRKTIRS